MCCEEIKLLSYFPARNHPIDGKSTLLETAGAKHPVAGRIGSCRQKTLREKKKRFIIIYFTDRIHICFQGKLDHRQKR